MWIFSTSTVETCKMKIQLKVNSPNNFQAWHIKPDARVMIGNYKGSIATVRRLIAKNHNIPASEINIEKSLFQGWY